MGDSTTLQQLLERVGFPILVAVWFMLRQDKRLDKIIELLHEIVRHHQVEIIRNQEKMLQNQGTIIGKVDN